MYKLQEKELFFCEARPIKLWSSIDQKSQNFKQAQARKNV